MALSIIVAVARNGVIGANGTLPWRLSSDLKRFKALTIGHTIVMGRRTFESIGRALPGRQNIVITSRAKLEPNLPEIELASSLDDAIGRSHSDAIFVIGGARLYKEALPRADRVYLTRVDAEVAGDTYFPLEQLASWQLVADEAHEKGERDDFDFRFQVYEPKPASLSAESHD